MSKTIYVLSYGIQYPRIFHHKNDIKPTKAFFSLDEAKKEAKECYKKLEEHLAFNENANELIKKISGDILYLDPPYNHREYGANYHLLNTIALYDDFIPKGKTGLREYKKSAWCKKNSAQSALDDLLKFANLKSKQKDEDEYYIRLQGLIKFELVSILPYEIKEKYDSFYSRTLKKCK